MRLALSTTVARLLAALPSAAGIVHEFGMDSITDETLESACARAGVVLADLENALDRIDWNNPEQLATHPAYDFHRVDAME